MKNCRLFLAFTLIAMIIGGCHAARVSPQPEWDYNVNTDFARLKTYNWHPVEGTVKIDNLMLVRIKNAVNAELLTKGLELSPINPDFFIIMNGGRLVQYDTRWKGYNEALTYEEGRLKLAFMDSHSTDLIWWGETKTDLFFEMTPTEKDKLVHEVVSRILNNFPPSTSQ